MLGISDLFWNQALLPRPQLITITIIIRIISVIVIMIISVIVIMFIIILMTVKVWISMMLLVLHHWFCLLKKVAEN